MDISATSALKHVARGNECVMINDGGNCSRQIGKVCFVGQSSASGTFLGFTSIALLALCLASHVVSFESTHSGHERG